MIRICVGIANAIPTAEGAILYAMQNSERTLHGSNCLVLGFGRCAKILAHKLKGLGARVMVSARKKEALSYARAYGYETIPLLSLKEKIGRCDFLFNTIPSVVIGPSMIDEIDTDTLYIELASMPGGIDKEYCQQKKMNYIPAQGLPGKIAPTTAAEIIYEALLLVFQEEDKVNG